MSICTVLDNNTQKFQDILQDNAAASNAVAWSSNNFEGKDINSKVNKALDFINKLKDSNPKTKLQADKIIKQLLDKHLIYQVKTGGGVHYGTNFPELIESIISNKKSVIFYTNGNISDDTSKGNYNYLYSKNPIKQNESFMADFDRKTIEALSSVGEGMLGFALMSTDNIVSSEKVNQTVDTIVEKIARRVIAGESLTKQDIQDELDTYYNTFLDIKDEYEDNNSEVGINHTNSYLENWDNLEQMVFNALKRRSGLSFKNGIDSKKLDDTTIQDEDSVKANNDEIDLDGADKSQGNYSDNFAVTLDSKAGLSGKLKLFLSTLENGDSHYLTGESLFENFDTVYNTLNAFLAGSDPDIYAMIERLKEFNDYKWVQSLIAKLNEAKAINNETGLPNNMTLIKQFVTAMNKHYIDMSFVQWINSFAGSELKVMGDNANSRQRVILADWNQRLEKSNLVDIDSFGKRTFNSEYANEVVTKFEELFKSNQNVTEKQLFDALNSIGIKLSYTTIKRMLNDGFQYGSRKFKKTGVNQLFLKSDKFSPITNVYNVLIKIATTDGTKEVGTDDSLNVFSAGSVKAMADLEAKNSKHLYSNSHNSGTKTVFSYTNDKFIIDRMYELTRGYRTGVESNFKLLDDLKTDVFSNNSYWLNQLLLAKGDNPTPEQLAFSEAFEFGYLSLDALKQANGKASDRGLTDLSPQEIIALKLGLLHNNDSKVGTGVTARRVGKLFYPTMSDKTNMINIQSIIRDNIIYSDGSVDKDTVDFIYRNVVKSEMNRMWEVQKETNNYSTKINIEGYNDGAKYFYTVPELNIIQDIFKKAQNGNRVLKTEDELTTENLELIKSTIKNSLNLMIAKQIKEFKDNKIGIVDGEKTLQFIDKTHAVNVSGWYGGNLSQKQLSDAVAADFAINYFIHNANVAQMFHGDYAQYFKGDFGKGPKRDSGVHGEFETNFFNKTDHTIVDAYNLIKPTFDNLGKRLAADLAPGYEADFGDKQTIKVTVSRDRKMKSLAMDYIEKIYRKNEQNRTAAEKAAIKAYGDINSSDAQSWTSLDFHIDTLFNFGNKNITEKEYYQLKKKVAESKLSGEDVNFTDREWEIILQPTKPIYANNRQVSTKNNQSIGVRNYIKTSSFPLIPQLVRGTELESIMRSMEKNGVDIHVFESGYKVGATDMHFDGKEFVNGKLELFSDDGSLNQTNLDLLGTENNFIQLPIAGFKIQQEIPYHDHPGVVNKGTQEAKLLFSNIKGIGGFKYKGQTYTGAELEKVYNGLYKQLYENEAIKLKDELFVKDENGNTTNTVDIAKLQEILKEEANNRGYSINDIIGLDLNEFDNTFKYPLWALPSAKQYESLIISIVDNRVRKLKIPGNSFVLGSEAGFKFKKLESFEKEGLATIKKYQDRIIFTSNFDGESLQSYREDGDGMKPSQVFVPAKLQGANGEFIDLMKYTFIKDGKLMLDEDRLPKDLLKMFGFRIPTQGHNSMAALEIAGFLPKECGDLIIASQDLVIQMGSDFDVDKLYTYQSSTYEINDNEVPRIALDNRGNNRLFNDILDVHLSVFNNNNKDLYSLILSPNGFGKLKIDKSTGLAFDIEKIKQDANGLSGMTNYLSPQYQMSKFFNGTSGKMGVGVFSSLSMLNAISQGKNLRYINKPVVDGKRLDLFDIRFGDLKSNGTIGSLKTLDGKTYISKVIEAFQSASVDNEKEQILYKLNINKNTSNVINALAMLGFDEETICYFINQPIIEEYVKRSSERDSSLNKFAESLNGDLFQQMITEFSDKYNTQINRGFRSAGVEDLKSQMKLNIDQRNAIAQEFWGKQLAILEKFKDLNEIGLNLQSLMQTVNAESKGLGRSIFGSIDRENKIDNIDSVNDNLMQNASAVGVLNAGELLDETMNGFVADYGTRNLNILGSQIFPYKNESLLGMFAYARKLLEKKSDSISANEEFMTEMFQAVKSYLFSNPELFGEDFDINKERKRLFLGESELVTNGIQGPLARTNLVVKTPSLAEIVNAIKDTKFGESNALLRVLSTDLSQRSSEFKLIKYMASTGQNLDESDLHQAFISLFREDVQIPYTINKKQHNISSRKLAEDLIKYTYLSGGIQEAIQFTRYIPIEILWYIGFSEKLKNIGNLMNDATFGSVTNYLGNVVYSKLVEQYIQHNPKLVPTKIGSVNFGSELPKGIENVEYSAGKNGINVITKFKPIISEDAKESAGSYLMKKPYVSGSYLSSQPNEKAKYEQMLYKWNGNEFVNIPILGSFGVEEYNYNSDTLSTESVLDMRNVVKQSKVDIKNDKSGTLLKEDTSADIFKDYNQETINKSGNAVQSILETIAAKEDIEGHNKHQVDLAKRLLANSHIMKSLKDTNFMYQTEGFSPKGRYNLLTRTLSINGNKNKFSNSDSLDEALLHEIVHAYTSKIIRLIDEPYWRTEFKDEYESIPQEVFDAHKRINAIRRGLVSITKVNDSTFNKRLDDIRKYREQQSAIAQGKTIEKDDLVDLNSDDILAYGLLDNLDFVTMAMTNDIFRNEIDKLSIQLQQKENPLSKLWNAILDFLGLSDMSKMNKDYVTSEILQFVETINESKTELKNILDIIFEEEQTSGYRNRTIKNASADATIALATDFNSAGERLTKSSVLFQKKKYIPVDANNLEISNNLIESIVSQLNSIGNPVDLFNNKKSDISLNIAGNGIYTMKSKYSQKDIDDYTYNLLKKVLSNPNLTVNIISIRSGGQTGFDEAGAKAGIKLGIQTKILAPKGWTFRNESGRDISNENQFKSRFPKEYQSTRIFDNEKYREVEKLLDEMNEGVQLENKIDNYRYFGAEYLIEVVDGVAINVLGYKGKSGGMQKILDAYNVDPNIDIQSGKPFRELRSIQSIENESEVGDSKYELLPGVFANAGQMEAIDKLDEFLNSKEQEFTLVGRGGTGKTTIIKKILKNTKGVVGGITVAHKAKKVLGKSIGKNKVKTIASALAIKLDEVTGNFTPDLFAREMGRVPISRMDVIIVDEASMISNKMYEEIMELKKPNAKVIFMGDNAQLPPIGASEESPVFKSRNKYTLTEKMRQAKTSPIIGIGSIVADNIESENPKLRVLSNQNRISSYDKESNSAVIFTNDENSAIDGFVEDFKNSNGNPDFVKIITFNNQNHPSPQSVKNLNDKVRKKLYGSQSSNQFMDGEMVTAYDTYSRDAGQDTDEIPIHNSDDFVVKSIELHPSESGSVSAQSKKDGYRTFNFKYDVIYLELLDNEGQPILGGSVPVIANSSKAKFDSDLKSLWNTDKQLAFKLKGAFANLEYGYAITSHKAQGSTYTNVYVMEDNILGQTNASDIKAKNQSLYVAVSRPTNKLVMISSENINKSEDISIDNMPDFNDTNRIPFNENVDLYKRFKLASDKGVRKIYKSSNKEMNAWIKKINDTNSNYHVESVNYDTSGNNKMATIYRVNTELGGLNNILLEPSESEIIKLKEKHGPDALEKYNRLTFREKESVLKCL